MSGRGGYDIHGCAARVQRYLALIYASSIPDEDKRALTNFGEVLRAQGAAPNHPGLSYRFTCGSPLEPAPKTVELEEMKKDQSEIKETLRDLLSRNT